MRFAAALLSIVAVAAMAGAGKAGQVELDDNPREPSPFYTAAPVAAASELLQRNREALIARSLRAPEGPEMWTRWSSGRYGLTLSYPESLLQVAAEGDWLHIWRALPYEHFDSCRQLRADRVADYSLRLRLENLPPRDSLEAHAVLETLFEEGGLRLGEVVEFGPLVGFRTRRGVGDCGHYLTFLPLEEEVLVLQQPYYLQALGAATRLERRRHFEELLREHPPIDEERYTAWILSTAQFED